MLSRALTRLGDIPVRSKQMGGQISSRPGATATVHLPFALPSVA